MLFFCCGSNDLPLESSSNSSSNSSSQKPGKLQLFGMGGSTCTQRVLMTLLENGADWELKRVDLRKGEHKTPEHLARQPFGQIPVLKDGDYHIYESRAICRYVNDTRGNALVPTDPKLKALMEQWISTEQSTLTPHISDIVGQRVFAPLFGGQTDEEAVKNHVEKVQQGLDIMDAQLAKNQYLTGDQFTLGDLFYLPYFNLLFATPEKSLLESRPHILAWFQRCTARPSWQQLQQYNEFMQNQ